MAQTALSEDLVRAGHRLLDAADQVGLRPQGAAWVYDHSLEEWRYVLVSALVDTIGRRRVYNLLSKAFRKLTLPEQLTIVDVHLESPQSPLFLALRVFEVRDSIVKFENCAINGFLFDGVIYRWDASPSPKAVRQNEREFLRKVKSLA
jgi:hypothetical protein